MTEEYYDCTDNKVKFAVLNYRTGSVDIFTVDKYTLDNYSELYSDDNGIETYLTSRGYDLDDIEYMMNIKSVNIEF